MGVTAQSSWYVAKRLGFRWCIGRQACHLPLCANGSTQTQTTSIFQQAGPGIAD